MQLLPTYVSCLPLLPSFARHPPFGALPLVVGWRREGKGEPTVGLCSAELPTPILSSLLCSASTSSAGAFSKTFTAVPSMGWRGKELRRSKQFLLRSVSGLRFKVGAGVCQNPVTANISYCRFFAASEKQGGNRPRSLWYELCLLVLLMALFGIC